MQQTVIRSWIVGIVIAQCIVAQQPSVENPAPSTDNTAIVQQTSAAATTVEQKAPESTVVSQDTATPAPAGNQSLQISRACICTNVVNREPQESGETFSANVGKLCCFSHITGARDGMTIVHKWYCKYELVSSVGLRIKADNWRTYSSKTIVPEQVGEWKVEIVNGDNDSLLHMVKFTIQ